MQQNYQLQEVNLLHDYLGNLFVIDNTVGKPPVGKTFEIPNPTLKQLALSHGIQTQNIPSAWLMSKFPSVLS